MLPIHLPLNIPLVYWYQCTFFFLFSRLYFSLIKFVASSFFLSLAFNVLGSIGTTICLSGTSPLSKWLNYLNIYATDRSPIFKSFSCLYMGKHNVNSSNNVCINVVSVFCGFITNCISFIGLYLFPTNISCNLLNTSRLPFRFGIPPLFFSMVALSSSFVS